MSTLPVYSFFPWLRQGLGNQITDSDVAGRVKVRSEIPVAVELTGTGISAAPIVQQIPLVPRNVPLAGPGDIVGIESRAIVRTDPRHWITNFEPNYVPCIEFYDEDFPWRYTPAKANTATHRLRPWIALVVLEEGEFKEGSTLGTGSKPGDRPLPFIIVDDAGRFPAADQLWAWAHVHVNRSMIDTGMRVPALGAAVPPGADPSEPAVQRLDQTLDENADLAYSRLVCPRKLKDNTPYHAFVVPVFESGRLAGLGLDPALAPEAMQSAWGAYAARAQQEPINYPYYHRWYFRTGTVGDFEYLVRLLQPRAVDKRVGTRDMDVQNPDANLPGITEPALAGVLKLGGALKVPRQALSDPDWAYLQAYENWATPYPRPFQERLAALINLADDYKVKPAATANGDTDLTSSVTGDEDPLITPPLYGQWHAMQQRLLTARDATNLPNGNNWLHQLNLDPRHRVTAGFGTRVVQEKQEDLMDAAWRQIGDVLEAQRRIRAGQLIKQVSWIWHARHIEPLLTTNPERAFTITAPVHGRVITDNQTVAHAVRQSALPAAATSAPMRRMLRPRARLARALPVAEPGKPQQLLRRLNSKEISAAPPRRRPPMLVTPGDLAAKLRPPIPGLVIGWLRHSRGLSWLVLLVLLVVLAVALVLWVLLPSGSAVAVAIAVVAFVLFALMRRWSADLQKADALDDEIATPADVAGMPKIPGFTVAQPGQDPAPAAGSADSPEGARFKDGLRGVRTLVGGSKVAAAGAAAKGPAGAPLSFNTIATTVVASIDPDITVPLRTLAGITLPPRLAPFVTEEFREPFAYPQFDMPMYKPLADISSELFLPNLNLIEQNSITLLQTNQAFIEAYMVGLNHEFARELLWREYPTDQRGSYFRQFWDVSAFLDPQPAADPELQKEKLRDITKLHRWSTTSALKDHDNRQSGGAAREDLVLTIRGELLKKYPNAVIYAHRAEWQRKTDGTGAIDPTQERRLVTLTPAEEDAPPRLTVRTPLYEAKVDPDIFFFGFDLTADEVKGGTGENPADDPGWFFVIKERPGEPRFGFDIGAADPDKIAVWNDLAWDNVQPEAAGSYVVIDNAMTPFEVKLPVIPEDAEKVEQHGDDLAIKWNKDMNAADVAYVLYQAPVLVAVHGAEMLRPQT